MATSDVKAAVSVALHQGQPVTENDGHQGATVLNLNNPDVTFSERETISDNNTLGMFLSYYTLIYN